MGGFDLGKCLRRHRAERRREVDAMYCPDTVFAPRSGEATRRPLMTANPVSAQLQSARRPTELAR